MFADLQSQLSAAASARDETRVVASHLHAERERLRRVQSEAEQARDAHAKRVAELEVEPEQLKKERLQLMIEHQKKQQILTKRIEARAQLAQTCPNLPKLVQTCPIAPQTLAQTRPNLANSADRREGSAGEAGGEGRAHR